FRCHLEEIRKHIVFRIVLDDFDTTLFVVIQRAKYSAILTHNYLRTLVPMDSSRSYTRPGPGFQKSYMEEQKHYSWRSMKIATKRLSAAPPQPKLNSKL